MGAQQSSVPPVPVPPAAVAPSEQAAPSACPVKHTQQASACPVKHTKDATSSACPVKHASTPAAPSAQSSSQPVPAVADGSDAQAKKKYQNPKMYNVYSQELDPKNQMPVTANQQPSPDQQAPLSVERAASSIPKGGTDSTWTYPSPQMFWNALVRKGKTEGVSEEDVTNVVRIHNSMNESTWLQVLLWEKLHPAPADVEGAEPKLLRFLGRPDELSPKARLKVLLGHAAPFDRHDWIVDRGGKEVRYVIDYYHDEANADNDVTPANTRDLHSIKSIKLDVRPAMDSFESVYDRIVNMPFRRFMGQTTFQPLPLLPPSETVIAEKRAKLEMQRIVSTMQETCHQQKDAVQTCKTEAECSNAAIALQRCTAGVICPNLARDFDTALRAVPMNKPELERSYSTMVKCLELFEMDARKYSHGN